LELGVHLLQTKQLLWKSIYWQIQIKARTENNHIFTLCNRTFPTGINSL